ncbi:hypothetical protein QQF64_025978, partial [Cirrhinus molitorella]
MPARPDMTCHGTGPDMTDHAIVTPQDAMTDPVVMPPGPLPGQVMMKDRSTVTSPAPLERPRHDAVTENGRWTFPLPWDAMHIERMETLEDFQREEQRLCDAQAFDTLVLQIARIGGKNTKDCVHKVRDRLFTNALMAQFNMKGKGKKGKKSLEKTRIYRAIKGCAVAVRLELPKHPKHPHLGHFCHYP